MMEAVRVFGEDTMEHKKLEAAAALMTLLSPNQKRYSVDDCWFDYGSKTAWTTILGESELEVFPTYQALYPRRQAAILETETAEELLKEVRAFLADTSHSSIKKQEAGMKILEGWKVKIEDIGPLAVCTKAGIEEIEVELDGVRMMIPTRFCEAVKGA